MNYSKCFPGLSSKPSRVSSNCEQFPQAIKEVMIMAILFFFHTHISSLLLLFTALDATQARTLIVGGSKNSIKQWGQNVFVVSQNYIFLYITSSVSFTQIREVLSHDFLILIHFSQPGYFTLLYYWDATLTSLDGRWR